MSAASADPEIRLHPRLDAALVARVYRASGRVHVPDFLAPTSAARIHRALEQETPWQAVLFDGREHRELPAGLPGAEREALEAACAAAAARGFSYRYANFRIYESRQDGLHMGHFLMRVLEFLNSPDLIALMRRITGDEAIGYTDAQATRYRAGDFLTRHDDDVAGKNRRAAYVLGFTPDWVTDWGGLLAFPDRYGHVAEAFGPSFNSLNLFRVPMPHAVTQVASFAAAPRYSITGWFRSLPASA